MAEPILQISNLCKSFGAVRAADDLSFTVEKGHIHGLIGPNGAGKTTLLNLLCGELHHDSGSIRFDGREIGRMPVHRRARTGLARSFQITSIFENLSVAENMALAILAREKHNFHFWKNALNNCSVREKLDEALARVDLTDRGGRLAGELSHGEKRQLEVGMALVGEPKLLLLDEPMAGQGAGGTVELKKLIGRLKGRVTVLLVEHDMDAVFALADRISVIVYGRCIASGSPARIRADAQVQKAYLGEG